MQYSNKDIWNVSYPILLALLAQNIINVTDTAFLGHVGEVELGASAMGGLLYICIFTVAFGFSRVLIGRLAAVSELPKGSQPERLAQQLEEDPNFASAMRGGNIVQKLHSGELIRQIVKEKSILDDPLSQIAVPAKESPQAPNVG